MTSESTARILCSRNCGLTAEIDNGQFGKIKGEVNYPEVNHRMTQGYICQKAARLELSIMSAMRAIIAQ